MTVGNVMIGVQSSVSAFAVDIVSSRAIRFRYFINLTIISDLPVISGLHSMLIKDAKAESVHRPLSDCLKYPSVQSAVYQLLVPTAAPFVKGTPTPLVRLPMYLPLEVP